MKQETAKVPGCIAAGFKRQATAVFCHAKNPVVSLPGTQYPSIYRREVPKIRTPQVPAAPFPFQTPSLPASSPPLRLFDSMQSP
jgi:hypothetical protein